MNRSLSKVSRLGLQPIITLAMVMTLVTAFALTSAPAQAQTVPGEFCIEGLVIDHEEKPLSGWEVTVTSEDGASDVQTSAEGPETHEDAKDPDVLKKGQVKFEELFDAMVMTDTVPLVTGTYTASLTMMEGYEAITPTEFTFPIRANMHDCVKIRFKVALVRVVEVFKIDRNHEPLEDWIIEARPAEGNAFAEPVKETTDISGTATFTLTKGSWIFSERPPKDSDDAFQVIAPPGGKLNLDIESDQAFDEPYILVFKNELLNGCLEVTKFGVVPDNGIANGFFDDEFMAPDGYQGGYRLAGWGFKLLRMDHSEVEIQYTNGNGVATFNDLPFGPYILVEEDRAGWNELNERSVEILIDSAGDCATATFQNEQDVSGFAIEGRKLDANGHYGLAGWTINVKPLAKGGYDEITEVTTDGIGEYRIEFPDNDYRIPGAKYELCEEVEDGWEPLTPTCQVVTLPEKASPYPAKAKDFINQQIGHKPAEKPEQGKDGYGKDDGGKGEYGKGDAVKCSSYHEVKDGEGLFSVGASYDISAQDMLDANPSVRNNTNYWVYAGQRLCIP